MEKSFVLTEVFWKKPDFVQRKIAFGAKEYWLNISFEGEGEMWSVIMDLQDLNTENIKLDQPQIVKLRFLAPDLINSFLTEGMKFQLSEGPFPIVGEGRIVKIP